MMGAGFRLQDTDAQNEDCGQFDSRLELQLPDQGGRSKSVVAEEHDIDARKDVDANREPMLIHTVPFMHCWCPGFVNLNKTLTLGHENFCIRRSALTG